MNVLDYSISIRKEASELLERFKIAEMLSIYGDVVFCGSYRLDLMIKKDIDISVVAKSFTASDALELGKDIVKLLNPHSLIHQNTKYDTTRNRPKNSTYFGVQFDNWNLDIWVVPEEEYIVSENYLNDISNKLTHENKLRILEYKYNALLKGEKYNSKELYRTILS